MNRKGAEPTDLWGSGVQDVLQPICGLFLRKINIQFHKGDSPIKKKITSILMKVLTEWWMDLLVLMRTRTADFLGKGIIVFVLK